MDASVGEEWEYLVLELRVMRSAARCSTSGGWTVVTHATNQSMKTRSLYCLPVLLFLGWTPVSAAEPPERIEDLYKEALSPFYHGVASGDPLPDGIILWTRVTQRPTAEADSIPVNWWIATDSALQAVVASGTTAATRARDFTVKVDARGLQPGQTYYYAFQSLGRMSQVGRTKTAPSQAVDRLKFAVVTCANYEWGYFSGYRKIAERSDLDAVIHVGDYLYEYPDNDSYSSEKIRDERVLFPARETVKLKHYRQRYATYHLDSNLRRAHRQHPFIVIWDDHEFANNAWKGGAENHQRGKEGSWRERKKAAKQAYFEWMPIRPRDGKISRTLRYGPLMDLFMIDARVEGRDKQIDDVENPRLYDSSRTMLGEKQKAWLKDELENSTATWKVIGNQVIFSEFSIGFADPIIPAPILESQFLDIWDGYPAERRQLMKFIERKKIDNTVILSGDIHASFAFEVATPNDRPYNRKTGEGAVAVEFVTPSLSAANFDEEIGDLVSDEIESRINTRDDDGDNPNPHMKFADLDRHGYMLLSVTPQQVQADFYYLKSVLKSKTTESWGAGYTSRTGTHRLKKAKAPAP